MKLLKVLAATALSLNAYSNSTETGIQVELSDVFPFLGTVTVGTAPYGIAMNGTLAAVANYASGDVSFFDTLTQANLGTITFDSGLVGIALSGTNGAVVDSTSQKVYLFSTSPLTSTGTVSITGNGNCVAMNGTLAAVAVIGNNTVNFIDTSLNTIIGTVSLPGASPFGIAVSGTLAAVTNLVSKNVSLIDTQTQQILGTFSLGLQAFESPQQIALNGSIAAVSIQTTSSSAPGKVVLFNTENQGLLGTVTLPSGNYIAKGIAINGTLGAVAVQNPSVTPDCVNFFDTTTFQVLGTVDAGAQPWGLALSGTVGGVTNSGATSVTLFGLPAAPTPPVPPVPPTPPTPPTPTPTPINTANFLAQAAQTANYFNYLNQTSQLPSESQAIYDYVQGLSSSSQQSAFKRLSPQFKIIQFAEEKLDLLLHKEIQDELYRTKDHKQVFVLAGYDNLKQDPLNGFVGYSVDSFYQMLGTCFERVGMNWLFGVGVSESYMTVKPTGSNANYVSTWGSFGLSKFFTNWFVGLDSLFGYSFLNTHRKVSFLKEKANSSHGLWNLSFDGKFGYQIQRGKFCMKAYDNFGYIYGHENDYTETGIPGDNFHVKDEHISQIRNQLGMKVSKEFRTYYSGFIDAAYVYEYYTNNNKYQAKLVGTNVFQTFTQTIPTKNYGRVHAGFEGTYNRFVWRLSYTGLYGANFRESSVGLKLGAKY